MAQRRVYLNLRCPYFAVLCSAVTKELSHQRGLADCILFREFLHRRRAHKGNRWKYLPAKIAHPCKMQQGAIWIFLVLSCLYKEVPHLHLQDYSQVQLISVKLDSYKQMWITLENILRKSLLLRLKFCSDSRRLDVCTALQRTPVRASTPNLERRVNIGDSKV